MLPRQTISHYELLEPLGRGGMGVVHKARDLKLGRLAALKFLSPDLLASGDARARFLREAKSLSSLSHPHIATVYEVDEIDGTPFLAMEYLPGGTLRERVHAAKASGAFISEGQILAWGIGLAEGLAHAHSKGIVHRDVKCSNAMFDEDGRIKLTDFGLAKDLSGADESRTGNVVGTVEYMSPEQISGRPVDHRSDLYSLGVVLYELATGQLPFSGRSPVELANKIVSTGAPSVSLARPGMPPEFEHIVSKLLSKAAGDRYQSAQDALRDLSRLKSGEVDPSLLPTKRMFFPPAARRFMAPAFVGVSVVAVVALALMMRPTPPVLPEHKNVLVLPLRSIGGDENQEVLCDALTETLTASLTQTGLLSVVPAIDARTVENVQQARRKFGVNLVLYGTLQRRGEQFRLTLNLADADKERQLGVETVNGPAQQPFQIEEGMLAKVADLVDVAVPRADVALLAKSASESPGAFDHYLQGRGLLYRFDKEGNLDQSVQSFLGAIRDDPEFALAYAGLAEAQLRIYQGRREKGALAAARVAAEHALALNPGLAAAQAMFGAVLADSGEQEAAVAHLEKAIDLDPKDPFAYEKLAGVYKASDRRDRAEEVYKKAIECRPGDWRGYRTLGGFYFGQQRYVDAERMYRRIIELTPDNHLGYRNLGGLLAVVGRGEEAEAMLLKADSLNPSSRGWSNLGTLYIYEQKYAKAVSILENAALLSQADFPNDYVIWGNLGDAYSLAGAPIEKTRSAYKNAVEIAERQSPVTPVLTSVLAEYYAKLGDDKLARTRIESSLKSAPDSASVRYQAGIVYAILGEEDRALKELKEALLRGYAVDQLRKTPELKKLRERREFAGILAYARDNS